MFVGMYAWLYIYNRMKSLHRGWVALLLQVQIHMYVFYILWNVCTIKLLIAHGMRDLRMYIHTYICTYVLQVDGGRSLVGRLLKYNFFLLLVHLQRLRTLLYDQLSNESVHTSSQLCTQRLNTKVQYGICIKRTLFILNFRTFRTFSFMRIIPKKQVKNINFVSEITFNRLNYKPLLAEKKKVQHRTISHIQKKIDLHTGQDVVTVRNSA